MSDIITSGAVHSELALAAYATNLVKGKAPEVEKLKKAGMTEEQANAFANKYTVVEQFNGVKGGSMTVFEDNVSHERILSIRGTEITDAWDLANDGIYALTGYNLQLNELIDQVKKWPVPAEGALTSVLTSQFEVDGHSAGGFTAIALTQLFPDNITHAYVYNSPGTGGIWGNIAQALGFSTPDSKITSFGTNGGISLVAGLGSTAGEKQIFVNSGSNYIGGSEAADTLQGNMGDNYLSGGGGDDMIDGSGGDDTMDGGAGSDTCLFGRGSAGAGNDYVIGAGGSDEIYGGDGNDELQWDAENDTLDGGITLESLTSLSRLYKNVQLNITNCTFCEKDDEPTKQIFECGDGDIHRFVIRAADNYETASARRLAA